MDGPTPRVFTIPPGADFLHVLADALVEGRLIPGFRPADDPLLLADVTIYLPTRRACRALEAVFVAHAADGVTLLPRIAPLGDVEDDDEAFAETPSVEAALPPPLSTLDRQLTLARLIAAWARQVKAAMLRSTPGEEPLLPSSPAEALSLAGDLGKLIDSVETEEVDWNAFSNLVPADYDEAWRLTAEFLAIAIAHWPDHLKEIDHCDPAWRRSRALRALSDEMRATPPRGPVIAAGSTGSIPATAALLSAIASLPQGALILPGLDMELDEASWQMLEADDAASFTSPQGGLKRLLTSLGMKRDEVVSLAAAPVPERVRLVSTAMRPAASTDLWVAERRSTAAAAAGLSGITLAEAANEREEALIIATAAREILAQPGRTVAVVTPDRDLARRVSSELCRWGVEVEDSAGRPLSSTPAGVFARLVAEAAAGDFDPITLLGLIQHPLARFGLSTEDMAAARTALEIGALRGVAPSGGIPGLQDALRLAAADARSPYRRRLGEEAWKSAEDLLDRIADALTPLTALHETPALLAQVAEAHADAISRACKRPEGDHTIPDSDTAAIISLLGDIAAGSGAIDLKLTDYPAAFLTLIGGVVSRSSRPSHARVTLLGLLEARLIAADRMILAGLDEGIWPPQTRNDPWLSRPMRRQIGLPPPERRIGLAAHDFAQAFCRPDVVVTRALKRDGVPTTPARWLQRVAAVMGPEAWDSARAKGAELTTMARLLDDGPREAPPIAPQPKPALALRPTRLSITEIETFVRDPYSIYARHILKLHPLDAPGLGIGVADRGSVIHDVLAQFIVAGIDPRHPDARDQLLAMGRTAFDALPESDVTAVWWRRFVRVADWFLGWEASRRPSIAESHVECAGQITWTTAADRRFTLRGRADRIDRLTDGTLAVLDYKTGIPPGAKEARVGLAPQLPLEAAMIELAGFDGVAPAPASALLYIRLSGGTPAGELREVSNPAKEEETAQALAKETLDRLKELIDRFEDENQPYTSLDHPKFKRRPNGYYDHLARVREWSLAGGEGGEA